MYRSPWVALLLLPLLVPGALAEDTPPSDSGVAVVPGTEAEADTGQPASESILVVREVSPGRFAPIAGARVQCWTEDCRGGALGATLVADCMTDEHGVAVMEGEADLGYHWLIDAPGYAVVHEYRGFGRFDDDPIVLEPGVDRTIRILDPFGRPLPDADVEVVIGCGHSPAAREGTTDADGLVTLGAVEDGYALWIEAPGVRPDDYILPARPDDGSTPTILTRPGRTARGLVVDKGGQPLCNVVVRELDRFRGPATVTTPTGEFELHGLSGREALAFYPLFATSPAFLVDEFSDDVPLRIVLDPEHPGAMADGEVRHRVDVKLEGAGNLCPIRCVRLEDGFTACAESNIWWNSFDLPPGSYRIVAGGEFAFQKTHQAHPSVPTLRGLPVTIRMEGQSASLLLRVPHEAREMKAELRLPGRTKTIDLSSPHAMMPADGPAAVVLWTPRPVVFPLPEGADRAATVVLPDPTRISLRVVDEEGKPLEPRLECDAALSPPTRQEDGSWELSTREDGEVVIEVEADGYAVKDVLVVLPAAGPLVDLGQVVLQRELEPPSRELKVLDGSGKLLESAELHPPGEEHSEPVLHGLVLAEGFLPMPVTLTADGPAKVRFPVGRIAIALRSSGGERLAGVAWLDGNRFDGDEGTEIVIRGVPEGEHEVLVGACDHRGEVVVIRIAKGEARRIDLVLTPRSLPPR